MPNPVFPQPQCFKNFLSFHRFQLDFLSLSLSSPSSAATQHSSAYFLSFLLASLYNFTLAFFPSFGVQDPQGSSANAFELLKKSIIAEMVPKFLSFFLSLLPSCLSIFPHLPPSLPTSRKQDFLPEQKIFS